MTGESTILVVCECGKKLRAPAAMGGKNAKRPGCGAILQVPVVELLPLEEVSPTTSMRASSSRGSLPPGMPRVPFQTNGNQPVLSYITPQTYAPPSSLRREGKLLVGFIDQPFPCRCIKCNQPLDAGEMTSKPMYWHHPAWTATLLLGVLIGAIILLAVRKKTHATYGLCVVHRAQRRNKILVGWMIALAGFGLLLLAFLSAGSTEFHNSSVVPLAVIAGIILLLASLFWAAIATAMIGISRIDNNLVYFKGCGEPFLASVG